MMSTILSSSPFLTPALLRQGTHLRAELQRTSTEMTTGVTSDPGKRFSGDFSSIASVDAALSRLQGYVATTASMNVLSDAMQSAMTVLSDGADQLSQRLLTAGTPGASVLVDSVVTDGARFFDTAIAALNSRVGDRSVFGGTVADHPPLPDSETLLMALELAVVGATTVEDFQTAITDWFTAPGGYDALYAGGPARPVIPIANGENAGLGFTAIDPAIRATLVGFATIALLDRGLMAGNTATRAELAQGAARALIGSGDARQLLAARIGTTQQQLSNAVSRNSAEKTALGITRLGLIEADPYETAVRLQDLETRLDSFYTLTARLSQLRLTDYLR